jgi:hypothetical protein
MDELLAVCAKDRSAGESIVAITKIVVVTMRTPIL